MGTGLSCAGGKVYLAVASCRLDDALDALPLQHVGKKRNNASHSATWSKAPFRSISPRLPIASAASSKRPMRAIHPLFSFPFPSLHVTFLSVRGSSARHTRCGILPPLPPSPTTVTGPDDDSRACVWNSADWHLAPGLGLLCVLVTSPHTHHPPPTTDRPRPMECKKAVC